MKTLIMALPLLITMSSAYAGSIANRSTLVLMNKITLLKNQYGGYGNYYFHSQPTTEEQAKASGGCVLQTIPGTPALNSTGETAPLQENLRVAWAFHNMPRLIVQNSSYRIQVICHDANQPVNKHLEMKVFQEHLDGVIELK